MKRKNDNIPNKIFLKNTILLTVIAIATLLVAVVGATFAYFTAQTQAKGEGQTVNTKTTELKSTSVTFDSVASTLNLLNYPGGLAVYGASATISEDEQDANNDYEATYDLKITYTNETSTDLDWELWVVDSKYDDLNAQETTICKLQQKSENGETNYWYSDSTDPGEDNSQDCTASAITTKLTSLNGTKLASGKLSKGKTSDSGEITKDTKTEELSSTDRDLTKRKINTSESGPSSKYYYLIVRYPNTGENQADTDAGKTISAKLQLDGQPSTTLYKEA